MNDFLFEINNCICSYDKRKQVLNVTELYIPRGKFVVILGPSGAGKSTLIETLGLMNDTLMNGSQVTFNPSTLQKDTYNLSELWQTENEVQLSDLRNKYFSFIFQETNLMPNFTVFENIVITQLIQGKSINDTKDKVREMMKLMGLEEIKDSNKVYELSGGQKQRVAFVRAVLPDYAVMFGDEPTGNLDNKNAIELMSILKDTVTKNKKTAIIVSHNIELALQFADMLILLTKKDTVGQIEKENIFYKQNEINWKNYEEANISNLKMRIHTILNN